MNVSRTCTLTNGTCRAESPTVKANLLYSFFSSCFTTSSIHVSPSAYSTLGPYSNLSTIECTDEEVARLLCSLRAKTSGPDGISSHMFTNIASSTPSSLCKLFNFSLSTGHLPSDWKTSNITPVYKSEDRSLVSNYKPISLLSISSKLLETIVYNRLLHHLITTLFFRSDGSDFVQVAPLRRHSCLPLMTGRQI